MKNYTAHKAKKVELQNQVHALANAIVPGILKALSGFVGKKVLFANGGWVKEVKSLWTILAESELVKRPGFRYRIEVSYSSVWFHCDVYGDCGDGFGGHYAKTSHYLGNVEGLILAKVNDAAPDFKTDFTVEEIEATLKQADEMEKEARKLRNSITPFENGLHGN
jgi:hypothetical protein